MVITTIGSTLQPLLVVGGYTRTGCRVEPVPSYNPVWCAHTPNLMGNRTCCILVVFKFMGVLGNVDSICEVENFKFPCDDDFNRLAFLGKFSSKEIVAVFH